MDVDNSIFLYQLLVFTPSFSTMNFTFTQILTAASSLIGLTVSVIITRELIQSIMNPLSVGQFTDIVFYYVLLFGSFMISAVSFYMLTKNQFLHTFFTFFLCGTCVFPISLRTIINKTIKTSSHPSPLSMDGYVGMWVDEIYKFDRPHFTYPPPIFLFFHPPLPSHPYSIPSSYLSSHHQ